MCITQRPENSPSFQSGVFRKNGRSEKNFMTLSTPAGTTTIVAENVKRHEGAQYCTHQLDGCSPSVGTSLMICYRHKVGRSCGTQPQTVQILMSPKTQRTSRHEQPVLFLSRKQQTHHTHHTQINLATGSDKRRKGLTPWMPLVVFLASSFL